jgi:DNA-binding response OmpR family regulator
MGRVVFSNLEGRVANQLATVLMADGHNIQREKHNAPMRELLRADIVFIGGPGEQYLSLLRRVRVIDPGLPLVIVTAAPETTEWLDALEAGATDYCTAPFDPDQVRCLIAPAAAQRAAAAASLF